MAGENLRSVGSDHVAKLQTPKSKIMTVPGGRLNNSALSINATSLRAANQTTPSEICH